MLELVDFSEEHIVKTRHWMNNPQISVPFGMHRFVSEKEHMQWFLRMQKDATQYLWALCSQQHGHVGNAGLKNIDKNHRRAEFWIYIGECSLWGKGFAKQATLQVLEFSFMRLGMRKIYLHVESENVRAIQLYKNCSFRQEGVLEDELENPRAFTTLVRMACLEQNWRKSVLPTLKVALMQPTFLSWLGYFELFEQADLFIFLDDFQFSRQSWGQKNTLFMSPNMPKTMSLPIQHPQNLSATFRDIVPAHTEQWTRKFLTALRQTYGKSTYYHNIYPLIEKWLYTPYPHLADMLVAFTCVVADVLGLGTRTALSSECAYDRSQKRSWRVAALLDSVQATAYYSPFGSIGYMHDDAVFPLPALPTYFQNHTPIPYTQISSKHFVPYMSIVDALFNLAPCQVRATMRGTQKWLTWDEALILYMNKI